MKILVLNCGSSSIKYKLFDMSDASLMASGMVERIGDADAREVHEIIGSSQGPIVRKRRVSNHHDGLHAIAAFLPESGLLTDAAGLDAVGHRIVHGGEHYREPQFIDDDVMRAIAKMAPLSPLHNPANLAGVEVARECFPGVAQVAVFDTAFHQSMPTHAYRYALPDSLYTDHRVRRYGFHGISHAFVSRRAAEELGRPIADVNMISLHLGSGASAAAIRGGQSIDTSMGLTPMEGLVMGTRCGDIDPAIVFYLARQTDMSLDEIEALLNQDSGLKGLCGVNDMREILARANTGDANAELALTVYCYRLQKYIGAYLAVLGRTDAIVFTGGVGENSPAVRERCCRNLDSLGIAMDATLNEKVGVVQIQSAASEIKLLVIPTEEELEIAQETVDRLTHGPT